MLNFNNILPIIIGYFIGSIPSAYIIAKNRNMDIRKEVPDGRLGSANVWKKLGKFPGALVGAMDFCKGAFSIMIANKISGEDWVLVLTGVAVIIGHNWSIFLHFIGGKGAAATFGNLFYLLPKYFITAAFCTAIPAFFYKKNKDINLGKNREFKTSNFLTGIWFFLTFLFAILSNEPTVIAFSPIIFSLPIIMKKN